MLIKTKYIETNLLYEVIISRELPQYEQVIHFLKTIGVIVDEDTDLFVLEEKQYEQFKEFVDKKGIK